MNGDFDKFIPRHADSKPFADLFMVIYLAANAAAHPEPDLLAIRWSRLLGALFSLIKILIRAELIFFLLQAVAFLVPYKCAPGVHK